MSIATLAVAVSALTSSPFAPQASANEVRNVYKQVENHVTKLNCEAMIKMLDKNYMYTDISGRTYNRIQAAAQMRSMSSVVRNPKCAIKISEIHVDGTEATAWINMTMWAEVRNGKKWTKMSQSQKFIETLSKSSGEWLFTHSFEVQ